MINPEKLRQLFELAKNYKDDIKSLYNKTYELTDPLFKISDSGKREKHTKRKIDSTILTSMRFLNNFIMSSLFSRNGTWGVLEINPLAYASKYNVDKESSEQAISVANKSMQKNSETVCKYINNSNMYVETAKAMRDCENVGTGIRKTVLLKSMTKPFTYEYVSPDNFYMLEDSFGSPALTFKVYPEKTLEQLNDMFGYIKSFHIPEMTDEEEIGEKKNILETVIPEFDENKSETVYHHIISDEKYDEIYAEETLSFHPFRVFRWSIINSNPWGLGIGAENNEIFEELEEYKKLRKEHSKLIVSPPVGFRGNLDLMYKVDLSPGAVNPLGYGNSPDDNMGIEPINLGTQLIPVDQDIQDCRQRIREIFMAQPLGDVGDTKNRSATEMSLRHEMFRKEFSGTYELLNTELLSATFMDAYLILTERGIIENKDVDLDVSQITYVNELTKSAGYEEVMNTVNWYSLNAGLVGEELKKNLLNIPEFTRWSAEKMLVNLSVVPEKKDIDAGITQAEQIQKMQALGNINNEALNPQIERLIGG